MEIRKHLEQFRELLFVLKQHLIRLNVTPFSWHCPRVERLSHAEWRRGDTKLRHSF